MDTLHRSLTEYTDTMSTKVPPLQHLARLCVRKNLLNIKFRLNVQSLPLPDKLKEYLLYSDCPLLTWKGDSLWLGTEPLFINGEIWRKILPTPSYYIFSPSLFLQVSWFQEFIKWMISTSTVLPKRLRSGHHKHVLDNFYIYCIFLTYALWKSIFHSNDTSSCCLLIWVLN